MKGYSKGGQRMRIASAAPSEKDRGRFTKNDAHNLSTSGGEGSEYMAKLGMAAPRSQSKSGNQSSMGVSDRTASAKESSRKYLGVNGAGITLNPTTSASKRDGYKK